MMGSGPGRSNRSVVEIRASGADVEPRSCTNHLSQYEMEERERKKTKGETRKKEEKKKHESHQSDRPASPGKQKALVLAAQGSDVESKCGWR